MVIVLIVNTFIRIFQRFDTYFYQRIILLYQCFTCLSQHDTSKFDCSEERFSQTGELIVERCCLSYQIIYFFHYRCIISIILFLCKFCKFSFLRSFRTQYIVVDDCPVHSDRIFPVVTGTGIFVCILDADFITCIHHFLQYSQTGTADTDTRVVFRFHAFFYFRYGQITACTSGESHNHCIISFFQTFERDRQMFFCFQRSIVCAVFCRFSVSIRINTEHGEITGVTGPHPVIRFATELTDRGGGSGNHTYIRIYFLIK